MRHLIFTSASLWRQEVCLHHIFTSKIALVFIYDRICDVSRLLCNPIEKKNPRSTRVTLHASCSEILDTSHHHHPFRPRCNRKEYKHMTSTSSLTWDTELLRPRTCSSVPPPSGQKYHCGQSGKGFVTLIYVRRRRRILIIILPSLYFIILVLTLAVIEL